jgi:ABC-type branched-subunit amino acid transport system substrate-binding protein
VHAEQAATLALQLKRSGADVVYIDGQPSGVATILRRMKEQGLNKMGIFFPCTGATIFFPVPGLLFFSRYPDYFSPHLTQLPSFFSDN